MVLIYNVYLELGLFAKVVYVQIKESPFLLKIYFFQKNVRAKRCNNVVRGYILFGKQFVSYF